MAVVMGTNMELGTEQNEFDVNQACGWGAMNNNNMSIDTGAAAQGFAPDNIEGPQQQAYSNEFSFVQSLTGVPVAMPQGNIVGQWLKEQAQHELDQFVQEGLARQAHTRTQSDPAAYPLGSNGQFALVGNVSGGIPFPGQQQMPLRPASDGQISKSAFQFFTSHSHTSPPCRCSDLDLHCVVFAWRMSLI